jgi:hypothetical protein
MNRLRIFLIVILIALSTNAYSLDLLRWQVFQGVSEQVATYWTAVRTTYWSDTRVALWSTPRNTEIP